MTSQHPEPSRKATDDLSAAELLAVLADERAAEHAAAARQLELAAHWADLHPAESIHDAATFTLPGIEHEEAIAGEGCPLVAEFCIAELGTTLHISTTAAKKLLGHALELRHRLPRLWAAVHAGRVPAWRARLVAETTIHTTPALSREAAAWVDAQVAPFVAKIGQAQLDRLVAEAIERFGPRVLPEDPDDDQPPCPDTRHVTLEADQVGYTGTIRLEGELDLADGLDLDHALRLGAEQLKALGSIEPLGARRAQALGHLVRHQLALDLAGDNATTATAEGILDTDNPTASATATEAKLPAARRLDLRIHLSAAALGEAGVATFHRTGRLDEGQRLIMLDQVKAWCADTTPRSGSSRSSTSTRRSTPPPTSPPTGNDNKSSCGTRPATSPGAPDPPPAATSTTSSPTTTTPKPKAAASNPDPPRPPTSPPPAAATTDSRPTAAGASWSWPPGSTCGSHPTAGSTSAIAPAPPPCTSPATASIDHDPAPHPAEHTGGVIGVPRPCRCRARPCRRSCGGPGRRAGDPCRHGRQRCRRRLGREVV
ncbi:DUF222 domain-containing protein [Nocardioides gansuensis]|uniref:DUF222 domain-containing protein n=1 Tax=Nocardioides gansuensis TaxID=2138300 RepID=UPI0014022975|nr:DUF222 domain-containing protein [Nocardioides gansuensis]